MTTLLANKPQILVAYNKLTEAEENLRFGQQSDSDIAELAATLAPTAKGLIHPLLVKKAKKKGCYEIIDGRRRWLGFGLLIEQGLITADYEIPCIICETEEEIVAASFIANTHRREPTHADQLITAKRLMAKGFKPEILAKVLGQDMKEVKKLLKLSSVDDCFLSAYQDDKIDLPALKIISRLKSEAKLESLAQRIKTTDYQITGNQIHVYNDTTVDDQYFQAVGMAEYSARGGRIEADLFDERPDAILDQGLLKDMWMEKTVGLFAWLKEHNIHTEYFGNGAPEGYHWLSTYRHTSTGDASIISGLENQEEELKYAINDMQNAKGGIQDFGAYVDVLTKSAIIQAQIYIEKAKPLSKFAAVIDMDRDRPIAINMYVDKAEQTEYQDRKTQESIESATDSDNSTMSVTDKVEVETEGFSHSHHERSTAIAGKALGLTLSQMPMAALDLTISTMFRQVCLSQHGHDIYTLTLRTEQSIRQDKGELDQFTGPIVKRLNDYLELFKNYKIENAGTGENSPFLWVNSLDQFEKLDLLANLTGYQVNMSEMRTNMVRSIARCEAAHVSAVIGHDIRNLWMPDAQYYSGFSKPMLLGFIDDMGLDRDSYSSQKRSELAQTVTELSIEKNFVPKALTYTLASSEGGAELTDQDEELSEPANEDAEEYDTDNGDVVAAA